MLSEVVVIKDTVFPPEVVVGAAGKSTGGGVAELLRIRY
jgi:hypothetical protein